MPEEAGLDRLGPAEQAAAAFRVNFERIRGEIAKVIVGHEEVVGQTLTCLFVGGHALLEGVPGLAKTLLVRTLAKALDLSFSRIQFTPDLMPADITGTSLLMESSGSPRFEFQKGPIFASIILADEINRATPKTQSALLEAMQERQVTYAGERHVLPDPFLVAATQNPIEMEGTYPLPEAQLDRFFFKILVPFSNLAQLQEIADRTTGEHEPSASAVLTAEQVLSMRQTVRRVVVAPPVKEYAARLVLATHPAGNWATEEAKRFVRYGSSPRGVQSLLLAGKVGALLDERFNLAFEDVRAVLRPALRHRLIRNFEGEAEGIAPDDILRRLAESVAEPR